MDSAAVVALASVALVVVTVAYTYATRRSYQEMERARLEAIRPALTISPDILGVNFPLARVTNVGRGNALHIVGTLRIIENGAVKWTFEWREALLARGGSRAFMPELKGAAEQLTANSLVEAGRVFEFDARFEDAFGRTYRSSGRADWSDVTSHLWGAQALREDADSHKAVGYLKEIAASVRGLVDPFVGVKVITHREQQQRNREMLAEFERRRDRNSPDQPRTRPSQDAAPSDEDGPESLSS